MGAKRLVARVLDVLRPLFAHILINSNTPALYQQWDVPVVTDRLPDKGALGGIYSGLLSAPTDLVFCVACDMPLLNQDLIRYMMASVNGFDVLVPRTADGLHPLHAVYSKRCLPAIERLLAQNRLKISHLFSAVRTCYLPEAHIRAFDPELESLLNVNTWQDVELARQKIARRDAVTAGC